MRSPAATNSFAKASASWCKKDLLLAGILLLLLLGLKQHVVSSNIASTSPARPEGGFLYFVNTTSDTVVPNACANGLANCSLRGAILAANSHAGEDGIDFDLPAGSIINLASALPAISDSVSIFGPGASALTVRRNTTAAFRIFRITTGGAVALSGMTIANGSPDSADSHGGGVQNTNGGTVSLSNCVITTNFASEGGGVDNHSSGTINLTNCVISENRADVNGGIYNHSSGTVNVTNCVVTMNTANRFGGGGIYNTSGTVNVTNSLISNNRSQLRGGGGIKNLGGVFTVTGSTISGNYDELENGGGIYNGAGAFHLTSSTISGNSAPEGGGGGIINFSGATLTLTNCTVAENSQDSDSTYGGGLLNHGTAIITNSTFANNTARTDGGGIANFGTLTITNSTVALNSAIGTTHSAGNGAGIANDFSAPSIQIKSTIVALNTGPANSPDIIGSFTSGGFNLIGKIGTAAGFNTATDQKGTLFAPLDPKLAGLLQGNGGPIETLAVLPDSPAIDQGTSSGLVGPLTTDQRGAGYARAFDYPSAVNASGGDGADVGAFELQRPHTVSRKTHGAVFDVNLPLIGTGGIECRSGGPSNNHQLITTFPSPVTVSSASITSGTGSVSNLTVSGAQVTANLTGVTDAQTIVLTLAGVNNGLNINDVSVSLGVLLGDTNGNGVVNATDIAQTKSQSGQPVSAANFRTDVNANAAINASDIGLVKSRSGQSLPP